MLFASMFLISCPGLARERGNGIVEYPDGDLGIDLGGGYEVMPKGHGEYEVLLPAEYREPYENTKYGPMVGDKFLVFPKFKLPETGKGAGVKTKEIKDHIFYELPAEETPTEEAPIEVPKSIIWGVSGPVKKQESINDQ